MDANNPFEIFKEQMQSDDLSIRINTVHKLPIIATLMPPQSIKSNLIPFLDSLTKKQDDQVVFAITEEYVNLGPLLGAQHTIVLPYLENLAAHDETVIRQRAVTSISKLFVNYSDNQINNFIIPLIIRLASNDTSFTSRLSATLLMCNVYPRAGTNKQKIRSKFIDISNQEMLLLQRVTATKLSQMCQVYEKEYVLSDLINILKHRSTDEQDQIRVLATESFKAISKVLTRDQNKTYIMPLLIQAAEDKSWRVRLCLAKNFTEIAQNFGKQVADLSLIQVFGHLLKDPEVDVKIEAVKSLDEFIKIVSPQRMQVLIPQVVALGTDPLNIVRSHSGVVLSAMIRFISKDQAYQTIQPLIKDLLKDQNQQVRKGALVAAARFIEVLGVDSVNAFHPLFKQSMQDTKWRVRLELLRNIADLSVKVENSQIFLKYLEPFYVFYLGDRASAIRKLGVSKLIELSRVYAKQWLPQFHNRLLQILGKDGSYHYKISAIYSLKTICMDPIHEQYVEKSIQALCKISSDKTPNVREACVKCFHDLIMRWDKGSYREAMKKQLAIMAEDSDSQVKEKAMEIISRL